MSRSKNNTPLRYPGGKGIVTPLIEDILWKYTLNGGTYAEPYSGGAGVALNLLLSNWVSKILLNDKDPVIYAFWYALIHNSGEFLKRFDNTPVCIEEWHRQKEILKNHSMYSVSEVGFATFYLNRCNRSGILKAGPIGGKNQDGNWKIDARFNKKNLRLRLEAIIKRKDSISVANLDALDFLKITDAEPKCLTYLDPPYFVKGKGLYLNYYEMQDHIDLANALHSRKDKTWILSYDNAIEIRNLYKELPGFTFSLSYSANCTKEGTEFFTHSPTIKLPINPDIELSTKTIPLIPC